MPRLKLSKNAGIGNVFLPIVVILFSLGLGSGALYKTRQLEIPTGTPEEVSSVLQDISTKLAKSNWGYKFEFSTNNNISWIDEEGNYMIKEDAYTVSIRGAKNDFSTQLENIYLEIGFNKSEINSATPPGQDLYKSGFYNENVVCSNYFSKDLAYITCALKLDSSQK